MPGRGESRRVPSASPLSKATRGFTRDAHRQERDGPSNDAVERESVNVVDDGEAHGGVASATTTTALPRLKPTSRLTTEEDNGDDVQDPVSLTWPNSQLRKIPLLGSASAEDLGLPFRTTSERSDTNAARQANRSAHPVGRLDPCVYSDLPPVDFALNPINLKVLSGRAAPTASPGAAAAASSSTSPLRQLPSGTIYSDEEELESSKSSSSSSDEAFNCRCAIRKRPVRRCEDVPPSSKDSDDDEWGPVRGCLDIDLASSSSDEGMFIPEPVIRLDNARQKPALPYHTREELQVGRHVWVVDEEDVETLLNSNFNRNYETVCNGKMRGTVMRHNGGMTMVTFHDPDSDIKLSLTMPRACLSLEPVEPYEGNSNRTGNRAFGAYYCNVGPRINGGRSAAEKRKGNLCQQFYECVPALCVPKESLGRLAEAQTLFQVGSLNEALEIVNLQLAKAMDELAEAKRRGGAAAARAGGDVGEQAAESLGASTSGTGGTRSPAAFVVDVLVLRSRVYIFLERFQDALDDANRCAELEPSWVRAHLSLARGHSALGNWAEATAALRTAVALLPMSNEIQRIAGMTKYLVGIQQRLDEAFHDVRLTLDHLYRKRLYTKRPHRPGEVLCADETPILAVASLLEEHPAGRCSVCFRDGAEERELTASTRTNPLTSSAPPEGAAATTATACEANGNATGNERTMDTTGTPSPSSPTHHHSSSSNAGASGVPTRAFFCSLRCQQRASLYTQMEAKHWGCLEKAQGLIRSRAATCTDRWPLEMAAMTLRLFYMVVSTHRRLTLQRSRRHNSVSVTAERLEFVDSARLPDPNDEIAVPCSSTLPPLSVGIALKHLGLFPLANDTLTPLSHKELSRLHEALTSDFREESKKIYDKELFFYLYTYVKTYFTPVQLEPASGSPQASGKASLAFFLPCLVGCTDRQDPPSDASILQRTDNDGAQVCPAIPDSVGGSRGLSLEALLAAEDAEEEAREKREKRPSSVEANCRIVISSAHSDVKAVDLRCEESGCCDAQDSAEPSTCEGPLLEMEATRSMEAHEALRIHFLPFLLS